MADPDAETTSADDESEATADGPRVGTDPGGRREVVVPMDVYKRVTVFGTLLAVVAVLLGFVLLDAATLRTSVLRALVEDFLGWAGLAVPAGVLSAAFALAGLTAIVLGAGVYVLSARFRTEEMGKSKDDTDEGSDNG